jgi:hypothetical protein
MTLAERIRGLIRAKVVGMLERLLRVQDRMELGIDTRSPVLGGIGIGNLAIAEAIVPEVVVEYGTWILYPTADNAPYGWGDPYEDPPGTPVNPPLGTIQASFDRTQHIARRILDDNTVVHGVNDRAGPMDWRSGDGLVLSYDWSNIYSGGFLVKAVSDLRAACIRTSGTAPELIWCVESTDRIYRQECTLDENGFIDSLVGAESWCTYGSTTSQYVWAEFSQDCTALVLNNGTQASDRRVYETFVPATFTGQTISRFSRYFPTQTPHSGDWNEEDGYAEKKYPIKAQYRDNVLSYLWVTLRVERKNGIYGQTSEVLNTEGGHYVATDPTNGEESGLCAWIGDGETREWVLIVNKVLTAYTLEVTATLELDAATISTTILQSRNYRDADFFHNGAQGSCTDPDAPEHTTFPPAISDPDFDRWGTFVDPTLGNFMFAFEVPLTNDLAAESVAYPQYPCDLRFGRVVEGSFGTATSWSMDGARDKEFSFRVSLDGATVWSGSQPGDYGWVPVIVQESDFGTTVASAGVQLDLLFSRIWFENLVSTTSIKDTGATYTPRQYWAVLNVSASAVAGSIGATQEESTTLSSFDFMYGLDPYTTLSINGETNPRLAYWTTSVNTGGYPALVAEAVPA